MRTRRILEILLCAVLLIASVPACDKINLPGGDPQKEQPSGDEGGEGGGTQSGDEGGGTQGGDEGGGTQGGDEGGGTQGGGEGGEGGGGEGGGDPVTPAQSAKYPDWFEMPLVNDADGNGQDDNNKNVYYASHSFKMNGRQYRNYTVCFDAAKHGPLWVAAPLHSFYEKRGTDRTDAYQRDPNIPSAGQFSSKSTGGNCNKGHLLGSADRLCCVEANRQVFYYTNISPQLSSTFNTGGGGWNLLEEYIQKYIVPSDTLYAVIGVYYDNFTDGYGKKANVHTIQFGGLSKVAFPTMFYYCVLKTKGSGRGRKVSECDSSELQCVAFCRSHVDGLKGQKPTKKELMSVAALEKITGFTYFPNVPNAPKNEFNPSDWGL